VEAMLNPTNERLNDTSGVSDCILAKAGPAVEQDLITLESCRTGDAVMSAGHLLQSKCVLVAAQCGVALRQSPAATCCGTGTRASHQLRPTVAMVVRMRVRASACACACMRLDGRGCTCSGLHTAALSPPTSSVLNLTCHIRPRTADTSSTPWARATTSSTAPQPRTRCTTATATAWPMFARSGSSLWQSRVCTCTQRNVAVAVSGHKHTRMPTHTHTHTHTHTTGTHTLAVRSLFAWLLLAWSTETAVAPASCTAQHLAHRHSHRPDHRQQRHRAR
jgi:hypothetical protein